MTRIFTYLAAALLPVSSVTSAEFDFFESKIRPVLAENCYECHSASAAAKGELESGLQLDTREGVRRGGDGGPVLDRLVAALRHEGDLKMPPKNKLSGAVIADFEKWIAMGAPDPREGEVAEVKEQTIDIEAGKKHWSFQPLSAPTPPEVEDRTWTRTNVDRFIRAAQEARKIEPNAVADSRTLVRRAYFDLNGLPPSPEQVSAFATEAEEDLDGAWNRLIEELLASEQYGERWARHWLDLVRFAESNGYAFDKDRPNAWRYRDWVIRALNTDMPYDQFVQRQLAGDLIAGEEWETPEKAERALELTSATGFIVAGPFTTQQTQKERERSRYEQLDDMVHTLGQSMLGLTLGCARCHDHKYDPVGMHDYYELAAMFADVGFAEVGVDLQPDIYRKAKAAYDKIHQPLVDARSARQQEIDPSLDAFLEAHFKPAAPVELKPWRVIGPFKANNFKEGLEEAYGPELEMDFDPHKTFETGKGDKKATQTWEAKPDWTDGEVHNDVLKGANHVFYLQREIVSPRAQSIGVSVSGNDGFKLSVNGFHIGGERGAGDAKKDEAKLHLPLVQGSNTVVLKIANGGGDGGFYFQTSLEEGREPKNVAEALKIDREKWNGGQRHAVLSWLRTHDREWTELNAEVVRHAREEPEPDLTLTYAAKTKGTTYNFGENTYKVFHLHRGNADNKKDLAEPGFLRVLSRENEGKWLGIEEPTVDSRWTILKPVAASAKTAKFQISEAGAVSVIGELPKYDTYEVEFTPSDRATRMTALRLEIPSSQTSNFVLNQVHANWISPNNETQPIEFDAARASFVQNGFEADHVLSPEPNKGRGWAISGGTGQQNELVLFCKSPVEMKGGRLHVTLVFESQWEQHTIREFSLAATGEPDVRNWAAKPAPPKEPEDEIPPRVALADWITDVDEGAGSLLARVIVNRLWQHHFGRGIVATPSDFGTRGEPPTHPELLDYLAGQLLANGWRLKPIHRLIMTSSVYMQGGGDALGGLSHDPENLLYWRKEPQRLEAEIIRDNLLAVSGNLDSQLFGKGALDAKSPRRSVYLTVKRSKLIDMLQLFDAPDAMQSIGERETSTVAPQALAMLNSTKVRNWAIDLSKRAKPSPETTLEQAVNKAYQIAYGRPPSAEERSQMLAFVDRQTAARENDPEAALQDFCHLLLCANEFVYVD